MHNSLLHLLLKNGDFLNTDISQGSVATRLGYGGIFVYNFVTNFLLSLTVKEFENWSIFGEVVGKSYVSCFFDSQCSVRISVTSFCFDLPRHTWSLMDRFRTGQPPCRANLHKWGLTQSPSVIVASHRP